MVGQRDHLLLDEQDNVYSVFQLGVLERLYKAGILFSVHLADSCTHAAIQPLRLSQLVDTVDALEAVQVLPISRGYSGGKGVVRRFPSLSGRTSPPRVGGVVSID